MAKKSYRVFVRDVAAATDDMEHKIHADPVIQSIYLRRLPYRDRVSQAISYWRSRPDYIDVNDRS